MTSEKKHYVIAVNSPFNNSLLTYSADSALDISLGTIVKVPLGKREVLGCIIKQLDDECELKDLKEKSIKDVIEVVDALRLDLSEINFLKKVCNYYHYPLGRHIFDSIPKILKRPQKIKYIQGKGLDLPFKLNGPQQAIVDKIDSTLTSGFNKWLIHGITGSGKTAVYIQLIKKVIKSEKTVLFLLPEINLTAQFLVMFENHIGAKILVYNSSVSDSAKFNVWKEVTSATEPLLIVGVRSAAFLPANNLGLIIVDEEHDNSFKQEDRCPYNARDVALIRAKDRKISVVLGSATPSAEIYHQFKNENKDFYFKLMNRVENSKLPDLIKIESKIDYEDPNWPLHTDTLAAIKTKLDKNEQVIVFVNRLGFAHYLFCQSCSYKFECKNCSTNLRYFKHKDELSCPYCEFKQKAPDICPICQNIKIRQKGFGTEKIQEILKKNFPNHSVERFDRDEIKSISSLEARLSDFHSGKIDILVGTQMLSKGHNFEKVNLVVVLGLDGQLSQPDFRANEKVYQMLTQVSGRSGRFGEESQVIVQSAIPEHKVFSYVEKKSFDDFYEDELPVRDICHCPPYTKMVVIYISTKFGDQVLPESMKAKDLLDVGVHKYYPKVEILGPRPCMIEKKVNKFTWTILLRSEDPVEMHNLLIFFQNNIKFQYSTTYKVDVDPYSIY